MSEKLDSVFNSSFDELLNGYKEEQNFYTCLFCGKKFEKGIIYNCDNIFMDAEKYTKYHIKGEHGGVFSYLLSLDKKITGISEQQQSLLKLFYEGKTDSEIQKSLNIGSVSTVRNHKFQLKERERQAKIFLTLSTLLKDRKDIKDEFVEIHQHATMVDDRYNVTKEEEETILKKYFEGDVLKTFHVKEKFKIVILRHIMRFFEKDKIYTERDISDILKNIYSDFVTLRRYLIEYGFFDRVADGSKYWVK
ncbi:DUF2087 domain-containing protein [bacterium]|nr:DUF2087 domain-containing protein [bacterium]